MLPVNLEPYIGAAMSPLNILYESSFAWKSAISLPVISEWVGTLMSFTRTEMSLTLPNTNLNSNPTLTLTLTLTLCRVTKVRKWTRAANWNHTRTSSYHAIVGLTKRAPVIQTQTLSLHNTKYHASGKYCDVRKW